MFICRQKITFILLVFLEILQRYCKLAILGTLDMPGYTQPESYCQLVKKLCVYLYAKNELYPPSFPRGIAKICKFLILGTLGMPDYAHPK